MTTLTDTIPADTTARLADALAEIEAMPADADSMDGPLVEESFEDAEIRMFPTGPEGAELGVTELYFEVTVHEESPFYDRSLGVYSATNIRNGGPFYEALADELAACIDDELGSGTARDLELVMAKGSSAFTGSLAFRDVPAELVRDGSPEAR